MHKPILANSLIFLDKAVFMKKESVKYLQEQTEKWRSEIKSSSKYFEPDANDPQIPKSIFQYNPVIWQEDEGIWHGLLGRMPEEGIWVIGTSPLECMTEFDKDLKERLSAYGDFILEIPEERRQQIHREVFQKIDAVMGWH
jgi:hypothetical protein